MIGDGDIMELKKIRNPFLFVDYAINRAKIVTSDGEVRTIGFKPMKNEFGRIVYQIDKKDEKYCVD